MSPVHRTESTNFDGIAFHTAHPVRVLPWEAPGVDGPIHLHVVDAPAVGTERGTFLLLHGEPSWSVLYEQWIPRLTELGYRCVAPDQPGFGRSDKPTDDEWYTYERHVASLRHVIDTLDLRDVHLVVQDWAGPIGLRQAVDTPDRFRRLFILNTWLHHDGFEYSDGIRWWRQVATDPAVFGGDMPTGRIVAGSMRREHDRDAVAAVFDAPFDGFDSKAGARAFPAMIPFGRPDVGGAAAQQRCHDALRQWRQCPVHVVFGDADPVFTVDQGRAWAASIPDATFDTVEQCGHFVQYDAPADCLRIIEGHLGAG